MYSLEWQLNAITVRSLCTASRRGSLGARSIECCDVFRHRNVLLSMKMLRFRSLMCDMRPELSVLFTNAADDLMLFHIE